MIFKIGYEIPPLRAIYSHGVGAKDKETAIKRFKANNPRAKIRKVEVYEFNVHCERCGKFIDKADHKPEHPICKSCYWEVL